MALAIKRHLCWLRELHYYSLNHKLAGGAIYDDLKFSYLGRIPDVIGTSAGVSWGLGGETGLLIDRYGRMYVPLNATLGVGLEVNIASRTLGVGGTFLEGFEVTRIDPPSPEELEGALTGWGVNVGFSFIEGAGVSMALPGGQMFEWFQNGPNINLGGGLGYTFGPYSHPELAWDWLEGENGSKSFSTSFLPPPWTLYTCDCE